MKMTNALTAVLLVGMLLGSSFLATENVRAWTAEVSAGPTSVTEGDVVEISITVKNTGSDSMKVTWVGIHFDWQSEDQEYGCNDVPQILASGATYTFKISGVPIPEGITTHTYHSSTIRIRAADPGLIAEWGDQSEGEYQFSLMVETAPPPTTTSPSDGSTSDSSSSDNNSPGFSAISAIGAIGLISLIAVMRKRKTI